MAPLQASALRGSRVLTLQPARTAHLAPLWGSPHGRSPHAARRSDRAATAPQAALGSSLLDTVFLGAALAGLGLSALPLLTGEARERNQSPTLDEDSDEADFEWGLSSVVSFLPYVNWTAWAFRGMNSEDPAIYYALAALYGLPWVLHDLRLDGFTGALLLLSVLHLQVERIAETEAVQVRIPGVSELASRLRGAVAKPATEVVQSARRKQLAAGEQRPLPGQEDAELVDAAELDKQELERWDNIFKERATQKDADS